MITTLLLHFEKFLLQSMYSDPSIPQDEMAEGVGTRRPERANVAGMLWQATADPSAIPKAKTRSVRQPKSQQ